MIDVVSAVIVRDGRILLTQRRADKDFPFRWESPGGAVEPGETHAIAMARELQEEIGASSVELPRLLWEGEFDHDVKRPDRSRVHVHLYHVVASGYLSPLEGQGFGWFRAGEMRDLHLAPANDRACGEVATFMHDLANRGHR